MKKMQCKVSVNRFLLGMLGVIFFFTLAWFICEYGTGYNPYLDDIQNLYVRQSSTSGYFADQMIVGIFLPAFLCSLVYVRNEYTIYYITRCKSRDAIWNKDSFGIICWAFVFSFLYVLVDQLLLFTRFSCEMLWESNIMIYLSKYAVILFLFFVMSGTVFQCVKCLVTKVWHSVGFTVVIMLSAYFAVRNEIFKAWTPFECLSFINKEMYQTHSITSSLLDYGLLFSFDILLFWVGCCLHHKKEYL